MISRVWRVVPWLLVVFVTFDVCDAAPATARPDVEAPIPEVPREVALPPVAYSPRYNTIAHELLRREEPLGGVSSDMYRLLDELIDEAKATLGQDPAPTDEAARRAQALAKLKSLDDLLIKRSFVYPGTGLTELLSDALRPQTMSADQVALLLSQPHNARRRNHIETHKHKPFYVADCDTASFVYLAIGHELGLPLFLVEVPQHNFIRWYFVDTYVNWETMDGVSPSDRDYQLGWSVPEDLVSKGVFLAKITPAEVLGYHHFIMGLGWQKRKEWGKSRTEYTAATAAYGRVPTGWNNLAWLLVISPDPQFRDGPKAVEYAQRAVAIWRNANELDTLACAYAEAGDFTKAIEIETEAYLLSPKPEYRATLEGFRQGKTWIQQHPQGPDEAMLMLWANRGPSPVAR